MLVLLIHQFINSDGACAHQGGKYGVPILALVIQGHKDGVVLCRQPEKSSVKRAA